MLDPYTFGFEDYHADIPLTDNPFIEGSLPHQQWNGGWSEAQDEHLQNMLTKQDGFDIINKTN